jgi:hypothetical protein
MINDKIKELQTQIIQKRGIKKHECKAVSIYKT